MIVKFSKIVSLFLMCSLQVMSQDIAIGQWRDHLAYNRGQSVAVAGNKVYCVADGNMFVFDSNTEEIERQTKIQGYSDVGMQRVAYDAQTSTVVVAYSNTNIDLVTGNSIINLPDIKNRQFFGDKVINNIFIQNASAYLACGFGVVVVNLNRKEVRETFYMGPNGNLFVNDITSDGTYYYAATNAGVYKASVNNLFLANPQNWTRETALPVAVFNTITVFDGRIYANHFINSNEGMIWRNIPGSDDWEMRDSTINFGCFHLRANADYLLINFGGSVNVFNKQNEQVDVKFGYGGSSQPRESAFGSGNDLWIADRAQTLVRLTLFSGGERIIKPSGPATNSVYKLAEQNGNIYVAPGDQDQWGKLYNVDGISIYRDNAWKVINGFDILDKTGATDILNINPDPNNANRFYASAWGHGLISFKDDEVEGIFNNRNSAFDTLPGFSFTGVAGSAFDADGNIWATNAQVPNGIVVYNKQSKTWDNFQTSFAGGPKRLSDILVNRLNQKWVLMPDGGGLFVFDHNGTLSNKADDKFRQITFSAGSGSLTGTTVNCFAEDRNGEMWIGTDKGICIFYAPSTVFNETGWEAQQVLIEQGGYFEYLLEKEEVTCIAVDGANRKWIGTANSGVYLISSDGTRELMNFNEENSPILSNFIKTIAINSKTGEVFFGTNRGLISYKSTATEPLTKFGDVQVYPNPVEPGYEGLIAINGLVVNCDVKITDISGTLIYTTKALGGQAVWDGRNFEGRRANTGVYLVLMTNPDGSQRMAAKIMLIN
jgi:hypothetical protein